MEKPQMSGQNMASNRARAHNRRTAYHEVLQGNNRSGHQYMASNRARAPRGGGGDLVLTMPGCVCPKVKDMGPFSASRE